MLVFERHSKRGQDRIQFEPKKLVIAGWTGRDETALRQHIEELAVIGVPRPSSVPVFYRVSLTNVVQAARIEVLGAHSSGEVEPVLVALDDGLWIGLGSDHTDRKAEALGVALSKQLCPKPLANTLWRLDEVADHWDQLVLRAFATIDGLRVKCQEGPLSVLRAPRDLIALAGGAAVLPQGTIMFCGTLGAIGGIRASSRFERALEDPVLGRSLSHAYDIEVLPIVA